METIKVIDILVKIANGEELPKKIYQHCEMFGNATFELDKGAYWHKKIGGDIDFIAYQTTDTLNDKVEIIEDTPKEDKKIEYIDYLDFNEYSDENKMWCLLNKINEIIDKVNGE